VTKNEIRPGFIGGVALVLPEKDSAKAIQLRGDARNVIQELLAPDISPAETS
jgi:hypothetical protein